MRPDDNYMEFEQDGRFGLSIQPSCAASFGDDGCLGSGVSQQLAVFPTRSERSMYISLDKTQKQLAAVIRERDWYADAIKEMSRDGIDGFMRRARVRAIRRQRREAREL